MLLIIIDLRLKLVFDKHTLSCDASNRSVVNTVTGFAGIRMEFDQVQVTNKLCTKCKANLLTFWRRNYFFDFSTPVYKL